jgi:hypothetical protein
MEDLTNPLNLVEESALFSPRPGLSLSDVVQQLSIPSCHSDEVLCSIVSTPLND